MATKNNGIQRYDAYSGASRHAIPIEIATLFRSKTPPYSEANRQPC
jgi:hypothetical protein